MGSGSFMGLPLSASSRSSTGTNETSGGDPWDSKSTARVVARFMDASDRQIAEDITRMEWELFAKVKVRSTRRS